MTDIEKKAREHADKVHGIKRRNSDDWEQSVADFLAGSQEGQREAFEAGCRWGMNNPGLPESDKDYCDRGLLFHLSRKEGE
jgi:hypothetical protein